MPRDEEVDRLYQLPLGEFTPARNALAKARGGADGAAVKALQKPSLPAWAVNRLYWTHPKTYQALTAAADALRAAHARRLAGKGGDVSAAEAAHRDAVRRAADEIRALVAAAGEPATAATMTAVVETLQALPSDDPPGRLTRPLRPRGLEALAGLVPKLPAAFRAAASAAAPPPKPSAAATSSAAAEATRAAAEARRAEQARRRELDAIDRDLKKARQAERQAVSALRDEERQLAQAERRHEQLRDQLQFALKQIQDHRDGIARLEQRRRETEGERGRLETRRATLTSRA